MTGDMVVGAYALRTFLISSNGDLLSLTGGTRSLTQSDWQDGTCIATCRYLRSRHPTASPPSEGCTCGIYGFNSLAALRNAYPEADYLVAVIRLEGQVLEGPRGSRAEAARVVALWLSPTALPVAVETSLRKGLPEVDFHTDLPAMIAAYPSLPAADTPLDIRPTGTPQPNPPHPQQRRWKWPRLPVPASFLTILRSTLIALLGVVAVAYIFHITALTRWSTAPNLSDTRWGPSHFFQAVAVGINNVGTTLAAHPLGWTIGAALTAVIPAAITRYPATRGTWWLYCIIQTGALLAANLDPPELDPPATPTLVEIVGAAGIVVATTAVRSYLRHRTRTAIISRGGRQAAVYIGTPAGGKSRTALPTMGNSRWRTHPDFPVLVLTPTDSA